MLDGPFSSLSFNWLRGGVAQVELPEVVESHPFLLVGQVLGSALRFLPEGGAPADIPDGGAYIVPAGMRHRFRQRRPGACTYRWSHLQYRLLGLIDLSSVVGLPTSIHPGQVVGDLVEGLARLPHEPDSLHRVAAGQRLGFTLLGVLLPPAAGVEASRRLSQIHRLEPVLARMEALTTPLRRHELAQLARLSPTRFHYVFHQALGCAPMTYLQRMRLQRAQQWLHSSDASIATIAEQVGIPDPFHFSRLFKRRCGVPPSVYRQRSRQQFAQHG